MKFMKVFFSSITIAFSLNAFASQPISSEIVGLSISPIARSSGFIARAGIDPSSASYPTNPSQTAYITKYKLHTVCDERDVYWTDIGPMYHNENLELSYSFPSNTEVDYSFTCPSIVSLTALPKDPLTDLYPDREAHINGTSVVSCKDNVPRNIKISCNLIPNNSGDYSWSCLTTNNNGGSSCKSDFADDFSFQLKYRGL